MEIKKFTEKLNKLDKNIYVIEEEVSLINGIYEAELQHDNVNKNSLSVYSEKKLTGEKITAYTLSTPSLTPWKTIIKIFSSFSKLYITYETTGDTVEAEDINNLQDAVNLTQKELNKEIDRSKSKENSIENSINNYKISNDSEIQGLKAKDIDLDNKKANLDYVNIELNKRYTKDQTFTKDEVLKKIQDLIGTAPATLDTFKEIADALGNDPNFATTIMNILTNKVDKVTGKSLSTNDFDNIEKEKLSDVNSKKHEHNNKNIIDKITQNLLDTWNTVTSKAEKNHTHTKNQITNMPTKLSDFENDMGYINTIDYSKSHNHDERYIKKGGCTWGDVKGV